LQASLFSSSADADCANRIAGESRDRQKIVMTLTTLAGSAIGLLAPTGFVKWLMRTDPEEPGILSLFFFPV
jgi:hypothetical protein